MYSISQRHEFDFQAYQPKISVGKSKQDKLTEGIIVFCILREVYHVFTLPPFGKRILWFILRRSTYITGTRGSIVVKALCFKTEYRRFDTYEVNF
jgi:hypothetical protein